MISHLRDAINALIITSICLLVGCNGTETISPTENEIPPGGEISKGLVGRLVDGNGRIVKGASVRALSVENNPLNKGDARQGIVDSVLTDAKGIYHFAALPAGSYNLLGDYNLGSLVVLIPTNPFAGGETKVDLGTDTLRLPGQIRGAVEVDGMAKGNIFCYLPGTSILSISDETGKFWIAGIPKGKYHVNYAYLGLKSSTDSGVMVNSNETTTLTLHSLAYDTAFPPPPPKRLSAEYDTLSGVVTLRWNRPRIANLDGFVVYRLDPTSSTSVRINPDLVRDTVYQDTVYRDAKDSGQVAFTYQVKSQNRSAILSSVYSPSAAINTIAPSYIQTKIALSLEAPHIATVEMNDTIKILAQYENKLRRHKRITWYQDGPARPIRAVTGNFLRKGDDTLTWSWQKPGSSTIVVVIEDSVGQEWTQVLALTVLENTPLAKLDREPEIKVGVQNNNIQVSYENGKVIYDTLSSELVTTVSTGTFFADYTFKKSLFPYLLSELIIVPEKVTVTIEPGTVLRLLPGAGFLIRGTFICAGSSTDSIHIATDSIPFSSPDSGGFKFDGSPSSVVKDSTHYSGSLFRFVSFKRNYGIQMVNALITIENCRFDSLIPGGFPRTNSGIVELSSDQPLNSNFIFRRNHFNGMEFPGLSIAIEPSTQSNLNTLSNFKTFITDNFFRSCGVTFRINSEEIGDANIARNEFINQSNSDNPPSGLHIDGSITKPTGQFHIQENNFDGFPDPLSFFGTVHAEIEHNDFTKNEGFIRFNDISGRFHHNYIQEGVFHVAAATNDIQVDSNIFGPSVIIENGYSERILNLRNNYWSSVVIKDIYKRIDMSGTSNGKSTEIVVIEPILKVQPTGAGRTKTLKP